MIGITIKDKYKVYEKIGKGGFAEVFLGRDLSSGQMVAVKLLTSIEGESNDDSKQIIARFEREAKIALKVTHPSLVKGFDTGEFEGKPYLVMEYVEGRDLTNYIREKGKLSVYEIIKIASAVLSALTFLYREGVKAHRDIKPANIMVTTAGLVKLMDLGIAKAKSDTVITVTGAFIGSPYYVSPEQVEGSAEVGIPADLYSLGVVMYELATGKTPYDADSTWGVLKLHLDPDIKPPNPSTLEGDIPDWLEGIILKCLEKDPHSRYQTPQEMLEDLRYKKKPVLSDSTVSLPPVDIVPDIVGMDWDKAETVIRNSGLEVSMTHTNTTDEASNDRVITQSINPKTQYKKGDKIEIVVGHNKKKGNIPKPLLVAVPVLIVILTIVTWGFLTNWWGVAGSNQSDNYNNTADTGVIVMPDVVGMSDAEAVNVLESSRIDYVFDNIEVTDKDNIGYVLSQDIAPGEYTQEEFEAKARDYKVTVTVGIKSTRE